MSTFWRTYAVRCLEVQPAKQLESAGPRLLANLWHLLETGVDQKNTIQLYNISSILRAVVKHACRLLESARSVPPVPGLRLDGSLGLAQLKTATSHATRLESVYCRTLKTCAPCAVLQAGRARGKA